ncbi:MAG: signal peptidase I [Clostridiales bacterium]|nr:signal peptidase I [Clostridiales bacterium]
MSAFEKTIRLVYDALSVITMAVITIMLLFTFVFRIAGVIGPSMEKTLYEGDKLLVSAYIKKPVRGDIVIITQPNAFNEPIVKRVIATGGQEVDIDFSLGYVYVDGRRIDEPYLQEDVKTISEFDIEFPLIVPKGCVFVMGDNRNHSTDSRSSKIGFVDENYILGKVRGRISPQGQWKVDKHTILL